MGHVVSGPMLSLLQLPGDEADAVLLLTRFAAGHPGVRIVTPHYCDEPWRADIGKESVPDDGREMILTADLPGELLGKLERLFARPDG